MVFVCWWRWRGDVGRNFGGVFRGFELDFLLVSLFLSVREFYEIRSF